jgi:hypothetical protein
MILTGEEIKDLAEFAGFNVSSNDAHDSLQDILEAELSVEKGDRLGVLDDDGITIKHYKYIACFYEYPEEGYTGLGKEINPDKKGPALYFDLDRDSNE